MITVFKMFPKFTEKWVQIQYMYNLSKFEYFFDTQGIPSSYPGLVTTGPSQ